MCLKVIVHNKHCTYRRHRMSKKIPSDVAEWTEYMRNKTGAVFFVLGAYTDEDGKLCIARLARIVVVYAQFLI